MSQEQAKPEANVENAFGALFTNARKKKTMSIADVASELNILKRHVEAIEAQNFEALPQKAFTRGFVLNYAKFLGLDENEVLDNFEKVYPKHLAQDDASSIKAPLSPMGTLKRDQSSPIRLNLWLILGVAAAIIFAVLLLKMINGAKSIQSNSAEPSELVEGLSPSDQTQGAAIGASGSALGNTQTTTTGSAITNGASAVLDFWVKGETAISVTDSTGANLMSGKKTRGGYQVTGQPPFKVEIENPANVDLNYNQNPVATQNSLTLE